MCSVYSARIQVKTYYPGGEGEEEKQGGQARGTNILPALGVISDYPGGVLEGGGGGEESTGRPTGKCRYTCECWECLLCGLANTGRHEEEKEEEEKRRYGMRRRKMRVCVRPVSCNHTSICSINVHCVVCLTQVDTRRRRRRNRRGGNWEEEE